MEELTVQIQYTSALSTIQIYENLLTDEQLHTLENIAFHNSEWSLMNKSDDILREYSQFLCSEITGDVILQNFLRTFIKKINIQNIDDYEIANAYMNLSLFGLDLNPNFHSENDGDYTIIVYLNKDWDFLWGGETLFFDCIVNPVTKQFDHLSKDHRSVFPSHNKALVFPSNLLYSIQSPKKDCRKVQLNAIFNLRKK